MNELIYIKGSSYYLNTFVKIGLYRLGDKAVLIDSTGDKETAKKVLKELTAQGLEPIAIINTHFHADHIGGNRFFQDRLNIPCYALRGDMPFLMDNSLELKSFYGARAPKFFENKTFFVETCEVRPLEEFSICSDLVFTRVDGHSNQMITVTTPDGVCYAADSLMPRDILDKYKISFVHDVEQYLQSFETLRGLEADQFVLAHLGLVDRPAFQELIDYNEKHTLALSAKIKSKIVNKVHFDDLIKLVFDDLGLSLNPAQYLLSGSTIKAYLSYLYNRGEADMFVEDNRLYWIAK